MDMINSRILTSHTYNEAAAQSIAADILNRYHPEFLKLEATMRRFRDEVP